MTKRAHEIASRQAEVARERKRKKKLFAPRSVPASPVGSETISANTLSETSQSAAFSASSQTAGPIKTEDMRYKYVKRDLRDIAIVMVPIVVVLIILAFVL